MLVVTTRRVKLVEADDELLDVLAPLTGEVLAEGSEPFELGASFYDASPAGRSSWAERHRAADSRRSADWWVVTLACVVDGRPVGTQEVTGVDFPSRRTVETFSWLTRSAQGSGVGTEMRRAALHLVFDAFGAKLAVSEAFEDNPASWRVSERLGYDHAETFEAERPSGLAPMRRMLLSRDDWCRDDDIELAGIDRLCRQLAIV